MYWLYRQMLIRLPINSWTSIRLVNDWIVIQSMILLKRPLLAEKISCLPLIIWIPKLGWPRLLTNNRLRSLCMSVRNMRNHIWLSWTMGNKTWLVLNVTGLMFWPNMTWLAKADVCWERNHWVPLR